MVILVKWITDGKNCIYSSFNCFLGSCVRSANALFPLTVILI